LLEHPADAHGNHDVCMLRLERIFEAWISVDPAAAIDGFRDLVLPGRHNIIRNCIGAAHTRDAEIIFAKVCELENVDPHQYLGGLNQLIQRVAREDPARAVALLAEQPPGTFRGELAAAALEVVEVGTANDLPGLVRENSGFFRAPGEAERVDDALKAAEARQR
jgi:hypothetical protein